jgi:Tfp pilus assembly protein PilF
VDLYENLGIAYGMKGDLAQSREILLEGVKHNPNSAKLFLNLGITCRNMGESELADTYFSRAFKLDTSQRN